MAQINRYDGTHITNNVTSLVESVLDVMGKQRSLETSERNVGKQTSTDLRKSEIAAEASKYASDTQARNVASTNLTNYEIAKLRGSIDKDLAYIRGNIEKELKNMGFGFDQYLEILKHQNVKNRMEWENELMQKLENLKHSNAVVRIEEEFQRNLKLANFNADEAIRKTIIDNVGRIISSSTALTGAEKSALFIALQNAADASYGYTQRDRNDSFKYGAVSPDKTIFDTRGNLNEETNKPGWEMRAQLRPERKIPVAAKAQSNRNKTVRGRR